MSIISIRKNNFIIILATVMVLSLVSLVFNGMVKASENEPTELRMSFICLGGIPEDIELVEQEINKIAIEKINAKVDFIPLTFGNYMQQYNLMFSSGEKFDLCVVFLNFMFPSLVNKGYLMPLGDLLDEYGKGIKEVVDPVYLKGTTVDGKLYSITTLRDLAGGTGIYMRKDIVEECNIDVDSIKKMQDLTNVFAKVKSKYPDLPILVPFQVGVSPLEVYSDLDNIGNWFGVLLDKGKSLNVVNYFETDVYKERLQTVREWYKKGYILENFATIQSSYHDLLSADQGFCFFGATRPGAVQEESRRARTELVVKELIEPYTTTGNVQNVTWAIPYTSEHPEKAMQFLNLMYTNPDIVNLFAWGIEGKHYEVKENGLIGYPEGVNADNSGYNLQQGWMFGNQFLSHIWEGDPPDLWEQMKEFNESAYKSKALGFVFDSTPVKTEIAALESVLDQYRMALETGTVDPDSVLPVFIQKLKDNGIEKVIAEKQRQLDEWAEQNK